MQFLNIVFWQTLVTTLVGVFGGASLAIWLERLRTRRGLEKKKREIVRLVRGAIQRDKPTVSRISELLSEGEAPSQRVFPSHYSQALYSGGMDVFQNPNLWGALANLPPMLDHLNRRLDDLSTVEFSRLTDGLGSAAKRKELQKNKEYLIGELKKLVCFIDRAFAGLETALAGGKATYGDDRL